MSKDKPNNIITEQELLDYLDGKISGTEANRIERQLLDSSFEEEALEGLSAYTSSEIKEDLAGLREKLQHKKHPKPGILNIAATIAFLIAAFGSIWFAMENEFHQSELSYKNDRSPLAQDTGEVEQKTAADPTDSGSAEPLLAENAAEETSGTEPIVEPAVDEPDQVFAETATSEEPAIPDTNSSAGQLAFNDQSIDERIPEGTSSETEDDITAGRIEEAEPVGFADISSSGEVPGELRAAPVASGSAASPNAGATISGTVYSQEDQEPLPGVSVSWNSKGAITDLDGNFEMADVPANAELSFDMVGMQSKKVAADPNQKMNVMLENDVTELSEVVVVGYGSQAKKVQSQNPASPPQPIIGEDAFQQYIEESLVVPEDAKSQQVPGTVTLRITISATGEISNVEIVKSLSPTCDQEAIRLIREGPDWNPSLFNGEPVEGSLEMKIEFK